MIVSVNNSLWAFCNTLVKISVVLEIEECNGSELELEL